MHTSGPDSTRESTERVDKILNSNYDNSEHEEVATSLVQMDSNQRNRLLDLLMGFEDIFNVT